MSYIQDKKQEAPATRELLTANRDYFVSTTGSDSDDGLTSGTAWATLQHAFDTIAGSIDLGQYNVTIQCADGTYVGVNSNFAPIGGGLVIIQGRLNDYTKVTVTDINGQVFGINVIWPQPVFRGR